MAVKKAVAKPQSIVLVDGAGDKVIYVVPGSGVDYARVGDISVINHHASTAHTVKIHKTTGVAGSDDNLLFEVEVGPRDSFVWPFRTMLAPDADIVANVGTADDVTVDIGHVVEVG